MKRIENPLQAPFRALPYSHPDITKLHLEKTYAEKYLILQGEGYRALQFIYDGFSDSNVKNLKVLDEEVWQAIKQKQLKSN